MLPTLDILLAGQARCSYCVKPLGRYHAYRITEDALISRLSARGPMHLSCAQKQHIEGTALQIIWVVKSKSPQEPSHRPFERLPGEILLHLHRPEKIHFLHHADLRPASYDEISEAMYSAIQRAQEAAQSADEITSLTLQIAFLQRYLPPKPTHPRQ